MKPEEQKKEAFSRREFLLKSAEVASLSIFGMGIAKLAHAVEHHIHEKQAIESLASSIASDLYPVRSYLTTGPTPKGGSCETNGQNYCGSSNQFCGAHFECDRQTVTCGSFACRNIGQPYDCGTGRQDFDCHKEPTGFACKATFFCGPSQGLFDCDTQDAFNCWKTFICQKYSVP